MLVENVGGNSSPALRNSHFGSETTPCLVKKGPPGDLPLPTARATHTSPRDKDTITGRCTVLANQADLLLDDNNVLLQARLDFGLFKSFLFQISLFSRRQGDGM